MGESEHETVRRLLNANHMTQETMQRAQIHALLAIDDSLRELVAEMKRTGPKTEPFLYVLDPSEDE